MLESSLELSYFSFRTITLLFSLSFSLPLHQLPLIQHHKHNSADYEKPVNKECESKKAEGKKRENHDEPVNAEFHNYRNYGEYLILLLSHPTHPRKFVSDNNSSAFVQLLLR